MDDGKVTDRAALGVVDDLLDAVQREEAADYEDGERGDEEEEGERQEASGVMDEVFDDAFEDASDELTSTTQEGEAALGVLDDLLDTLQHDEDEPPLDAVTTTSDDIAMEAGQDDTVAVTTTADSDKTQDTSDGVELPTTNTRDDEDCSASDTGEDDYNSGAVATTQSSIDTVLHDGEVRSPPIDAEKDVAAAPDWVPSVGERDVILPEAAPETVAAEDLEGSTQAEVHTLEVDTPLDCANDDREDASNSSDVSRDAHDADTADEDVHIETSGVDLNLTVASEDRILVPDDLPELSTPQEQVDSDSVPVPMRDEVDASVFPPPAPIGRAVVVGSMIPVGMDDDDDEDSDSQEEDDGEQLALPPPLNLGQDDDGDDDDELEVDPTVANTITLEQQSAVAAISTAALGTTTATQAHESGRLGSVPPPKPSSSTDEIEFSFADEVRVAHVVVPPSAFVDDPVARTARDRAHDNSVESAFGISYSSLRKKRRDGADANERGGYSLPTGAALPDEREFERELVLSSDVSLSVKATVHEQTIMGPGNDVDDDDDEFGSVLVSSTGSGEVSPRTIEMRRASLHARTAQEEDRIIEELKRATDKEKALYEAVAPPITQLSESGSALTLRELHGIYKRGLGDQGVLLDESEDAGCTTKAPQTAAPSSSVARPVPLSVMGRILSKPAIMAQAITEEDEDEDNSESSKKKCEALTSNDNRRDDSGDLAGADEWREIELTHTSDRQARGELVAVSSPSTINSAGQVPPPLGSQSPTTFWISYTEAFDFCVQSDELLAQRDKIVAEDFAEPGRSCFACFSPRPRLLFPNALDERDRVFCLAATSYAACSDVFSRVLQTLYAKLTRTQRAVPHSGSHWEDIGFQGSDPATDLRGCGVLSLLQMLFFVETHAELALRFHTLSQHPTRHFPLACTLINITLQCVLALRSGALYKECNKHTSVFCAVNQFYVALAAELMDEIHASADAVPIILKEVLDDARANPDRVLEHFAKGGTPDAGAQPPPSPRKPASRHIELTEIALQSAATDDGDNE